MFNGWDKMLYGDVMKKGKILIASRYYKPINTPRAFRTYELVNEFIRRKYEVITFLPEDAEVGDEVRHIIVSHGNMRKSVNRANINNKGIKNITLHKIRKIIVYFLGEGPKTLQYAVALYKALKKHFSNKENNHYNAIISISYPFYINVMLALAKRFISSSTIIIADCGDPFYANPQIKRAFYLKYVEKWTLEQFDYVTIPVEEARECYAGFLSTKKIQVIPQGFKLMNISNDIYRPNNVPIFGYAGMFYESIRNPRYFFDYLLNVEQDFCFKVYAIPDGFTRMLLAEYKDKLGDKLDVREAIDREKLIPEMATWEFVINFDNDNSNQRPSKLIDYAMSKRPILSFNQATFKPEVFTAFLHGDYSDQEHIDLSQYDIRTVVDKFEQLFHKTK